MFSGNEQCCFVQIHSARSGVCRMKRHEQNTRSYLRRGPGGEGRSSVDMRYEHIRAKKVSMLSFVTRILIYRYVLNLI